MTPQPLIVVHNVPASSRWYQAALGFDSGHGGPDYERLLADGRMVMQLHAWDVHNHPYLGDPSAKPYGNGAVLWFQTEAIDAAYARALWAGAQVLQALHVNPNAQHREFWLRDPDGYVVVVAGAYGDTGAGLPAARSN